jgi:hypothetical protein
VTWGLVTAARTSRLILDLTDDEIAALGYALAAGVDLATARGEPDVEKALKRIYVKVYAGWEVAAEKAEDGGP